MTVMMIGMMITTKNARDEHIWGAAVEGGGKRLSTNSYLGTPEVVFFPR